MLKKKKPALFLLAFRKLFILGIYTLLGTICTAQAPEFVWGKTFGGIGNQKVRDINIAPDGSIFVCGYFEDAINIDNTTLTADGSNKELFFAKLDSNGNLLWLKKEGIGTVGYANSWSEKISGTTDGGCILSGFYSGEVYFNGNVMPQSPQTAANPFQYCETFLAKYDADGNLIWLKHPLTVRQNASAIGWHILTPEGEIAESNIIEYPFVLDDVDTVSAPDTSLKAGYSFVVRNADGSIKSKFEFSTAYPYPKLDLWEYYEENFYIEILVSSFYSSISPLILHQGGGL